MRGEKAPRRVAVADATVEVVEVVNRELGDGRNERARTWSVAAIVIDQEGLLFEDRVGLRSRVQARPVA